MLFYKHHIHFINERVTVFMEYSIIDRPSDAFQQPVAREHIMAMCQRAFGEEIQIESVRELDGGLCNNTYLICINGMQLVVLRVAPHPARQIRGEQRMRNELASLPFLAPIAPLVPRILMADFTHQILERDYMFQTFMDGEQWARVKNEFTSEEKKVLWRQLGAITKKIHSVQGDTFGKFDRQFSSWSLAVTDWLTSIIRALEDASLDATDIRAILDIAQAHSWLLDEITRPHFLHGDLWMVNILVKREAGEPKIVAVLDSDGASWGDPMADWTMFLLHINAGSESDAFWETYGEPERSPGTQFRFLVYQGGHLGAARLEHHRLCHPDTVKRSYQDMQMVVEVLRKLSVALS
jgi:aminoglycoside phosphotransferase (APT) family kinase protein